MLLIFSVVTFSLQVSSAIKLFSQTSVMLLYSHTEPQVFRLLPFPVSTPNWQTGHEHDLCATAITRNGNKDLQKYSWIKLSTAVSPQRRFYRLLDIQKLLSFFFMMKRWQIVYFAGLLFFLNKAFGSQTKNLCQFRGWEREEVKMGLYFSFSFLHRDCFLAFHHVLTLLSQLDLNLFLRVCLCWHNFIPQMRSQWSHFARGI